jgi:hypothetical protein
VSVAVAQSLTNAAYVMVMVILKELAIVMAMYLIVQVNVGALQWKMNAVFVMEMVHPAPFT